MPDIPNFNFPRYGLPDLLSSMRSGFAPGGIRNIKTHDEGEQTFHESLEEVKQKLNEHRKEYVLGVDRGIRRRLKALGLVPKTDDLDHLLSSDVIEHLTCYEYEQDGAVPPLGCPTGSTTSSTEPQEWRVVREWVYSREGARIVLGQEHHNGMRARAVFHPDNMLERPSPLQD